MILAFHRRFIFLKVSRSMAACEGALLLVDATQGIEAQTMANALLATEHKLKIIPVINKCDILSSDPDRVQSEIENNLGIDCTNAVRISAKTGFGVQNLLENIIKYFPAPTGSRDKPLRARVFDSYFDKYKGVVIYFHVVDGKVVLRLLFILFS